MPTFIFTAVYPVVAEAILISSTLGLFLAFDFMLTLHENPALKRFVEGNGTRTWKTDIVKLGYDL